MKTQGYGKSFGKVILFGEHSVVYGGYAIVQPFLNAGIETTSKISPNLSITINNQVFDETFPLYLNPYLLIIEKIIKLHQLSASFTLDISTSLPYGAGLGYSAALAVAIVRSIYDLLGLDLDKATLLNFVSIAEDYFHAKPSGIDANCIIDQQTLIYQKDKGAMPIELNLKGKLLIVYSNTVGSTLAAINQVSAKFIRNYNQTTKTIDELKHLVDQALLAFRIKDKITIGRMMVKAQHIYQKWQLSTKNIQKIIKLSLKNEALGAKISGSGLGGCVICLMDNQTDAQNLQSILANNGFTTSWIIDI